MPIQRGSCCGLPRFIPAQLQSYFNDHIFQMEIDEFRKEGLGNVVLSYADNKPVLELFTGRFASTLRARVCVCVCVCVYSARVFSQRLATLCVCVCVCVCVPALRAMVCARVYM